MSKIGISESLSNLIKISNDGILIVDNTGTIIYCNKASQIMLNKSELLNHDFGIPIIVDSSCEINILLATGEIGIAEMKVIDTEWEGDHAFLISLYDITDIVKVREEFHSLSITDELTGLLNRRGFFVFANHHLKLIERSKKNQNEKTILLLFLDLDGLKKINDRIGHHEGDNALIQTAKLLKKIFRRSDVLARIGGDEFAVLAISTDEAQIVNDRIQDNLDIFNKNSKLDYKLSISIGIIKCDTKKTYSLDELIQKADLLMYESKAKKKLNRIN